MQTDLFSGLLGAVHETGHAMYDLGLPQEWRDQPVGRDRGLALEESQSLLFEMNVGRSRAFVQYLRPLLEKHFGVSGPEWEPENLYRRFTHVQRSLIRVDADELTYPLHIMLRYELEKKMLSGELPVRDLPEAWNAGMEQRLEMRPDGRRRRLPAGHSLGGRARSAISRRMRSARSSPRSLGDACAPRARARAADRRAASSAACSTGCATMCTAWAPSCRCKELMKQATGQPLTATASLRYLEAKYLEASRERPPIADAEVRHRRRSARRRPLRHAAQARRAAARTRSARRSPTIA